MSLDYYGVMDILLIARGIATLLFSLIIGVFSLYLGFKFFNLFTRDLDEEAEIKENNTSVGILAGSFIFSLGLVLHSTVSPLVDSLFYAMSGGTAGAWLTALGLILVQFLLALFTGTLMLWLGVRIFINMNHGIREFEEIRKNNLAVAVLASATVIALSFFVASGLRVLLAALVPVQLPIP